MKRLFARRLIVLRSIGVMWLCLGLAGVLAFAPAGTAALQVTSTAPPYPTPLTHETLTPRPPLADTPTPTLAPTVTPTALPTATQRPRATDAPAPPPPTLRAEHPRPERSTEGSRRRLGSKAQDETDTPTATPPALYLPETGEHVTRWRGDAGVEAFALLSLLGLLMLGTRRRLAQR